MSNAMVQSPCEDMRLAAFFAPNLSSMSPKCSICRLSLSVEYNPEKTTSRLTALPRIMLNHSASGNSGQLRELMRCALTFFGSFAHFLSSPMVCLSSGRKTIPRSLSLAAHGRSDSLILLFFLSSEEDSDD